MNNDTNTLMLEASASRGRDGLPKRRRSFSACPAATTTSGQQQSPVTMLQRTRERQLTRQFADPSPSTVTHPLLRPRRQPLLRTARWCALPSLRRCRLGLARMGYAGVRFYAGQPCALGGSGSTATHTNPRGNPRPTSSTSRVAIKGRPLPLIVMLHGCTQTSRRFRRRHAP